MSLAVTEPSLHRAVALVAAVDRRLMALVDAGRLPYHQPCDGEEAVLVGGVAALERRDWVFSGRQVNAAALWRGLPLASLLRRALTGEGEAAVAALQVVAMTHGPATRLPHAAGLAWAARKDGVVALCELGDGAVSDGDFHTGVNFAGVLRAPVVYLVRSEAEQPVASRGEGYGVPAVTVDGRDVVAVRDAVRDAASRARAGGGPTLVEARVKRGERVASAAAISAHEDAIETALAQAEGAN